MNPSRIRGSLAGTPASSPPDTGTVLVWDWPVRIFHWLLVLFISFSIYTGLDGSLDAMIWHMRSGYCILTLVLFRCIWGFLGTHYALFADFIRGPGTTFRYLYGFFRAHARAQPVQSHGLGHNPAGGWMIVCMLIVLVLQAGSGLFATDQIFVAGPLAHLVNSQTQSALTSMHHLGPDVLVALVGLHLLAILLHWRIGGEILLPAMLHGRKFPAPGAPFAVSIDSHRIFRALVILTISSVLVYYLITRL